MSEPSPLPSGPLFAAAVARQRAGDWSGAEALCRQLLAVQPDHADALHLLGLALSHNGRHAEAIAALRRAVPSRADPVLLNNLGEALRKAGQLDEALLAYDQALRLAPHFPEAHFHRGVALKAAGRRDEALASFRRAVELRPSYAKALYNLANTLREEGRVYPALDAYRQALTSRPDWPELHLNLANTLAEVGEAEQAVTHYARARQLAPDDADIDIGLGSAYQTLGDTARAAACYRHALVRRPERWLLALRADALCAPILPSRAYAAAYQERLAATLQRYQEQPLRADPAELHTSGAEPPMALAYQGGDLLPLLTRYGDLFAGALLAVESAPPSPRGKPRAGVVVTQGHEGVFARCLGGLVERLADDELSVSVVCSRAGVNVLRHLMPGTRLEFFVLPERLDQAAEQLRAAGFDLLHYWESGTDSTNYFLPYVRPAPVQTATWGWPVTAGNLCMDYYVSCRLLEPPEGPWHYRETLLLLEQLPAYYQRPPVPEPPPGRDRFDLGAAEHLYLCTQNLRKVHPDMDPLLADLLRADPQGRLLLIADSQAAVSERLRSRLAAAMPDVADRVRILPRMERADYLGLVALADVILDTFPYGGGANTIYDAVAAGTPVVTLPGEFHRGRWALAVYQKLGLAGPAAASPADYVRLAVNLATDRNRRAELGSVLRERNDVLFEQTAAVRELRELFLRLIQESRERL